MIHVRRLDLPLIFLSILLILGHQACAGTYKDRDGASHAWSVDQSHALIWEGAPYVPFGIIFEPGYLSEQTDESWTSDESDVAAFKLAGVEDVVIRPTKGLTSAPIPAFQRLIDLLEANGMRYGIELYDPPYAPLTGYVVEPAVNRVGGVKESGQVVRSFSDTKLAVYALCDAKTAALRDGGRAVAVNGEVSVQVSLRSPDEHVLLLYPLKVMTPQSADWGLPDLWSEFDSRRDRLVLFLRQIKFGKGLRFFVDPFTERLGIHGEVQSLIPTSTAFRLEFSAWLAKKYASPREAGPALGVLQHDIGSFQEAARLIPLWKNGRGAPVVYDDSTGRTYAADASKSSLWADFLEFRVRSIRGYMDGMADAAKRLVDVPVVYTATGLQPIFQGYGSVGYEGLAVPASGAGLPEAGGRVLSLADGSSRSMWIVSRLKADPAVFAKKEDLFAAFNTLRDLGAKGFFVADMHGTAVASADLLIWLGEYASLGANDKHFAGYVPQTVYYPEGADHVSIKRLSSGAWWLPSLMDGANLYLGTAMAGYTLINPKTRSVDVYIWSLSGQKMIHVPAVDAVVLVDISGAQTEVKPKKGRAELIIGEEPTLIRGVDAEQFLPLEVVAEAMQDFEKLIIRAESKGMDSGDYRRTLKRANELFGKNQLVTCLDMVQVSSEELKVRLRGLEMEGIRGPGGATGGGAQ